MNQESEIKEALNEQLDMTERMGEEILKKDGLFRIVARVAKRHYEAFLAEGFTEEQAIRLTAARASIPTK